MEKALSGVWGRVRQQGQHVFLLRAEHIGPTPNDIQYPMAIARKRLGLCVSFQGLQGQSRQLRGQIAGRGPTVHQQAHGPVLHGLGCLIPVIPGLGQLRVQVDPLRLLRQGIIGIQGRFGPLDASQRPPVSADSRHRLLGFF